MLKYTQSEIKSKNSSQILLTGSLVLGEVENVLEKLKVAVEKYSKIELQLRSIDEIDMSGVQLIIAFKKKMNKLNKTVSIVIELSEEKEKLLERAGLSELL